MQVNTYFTQNAALKQKKREKKMNEYMTMKKIGVICKAWYMIASFINKQ